VSDVPGSERLTVDATIRCCHLAYALDYFTLLPPSNWTGNLHFSIWPNVSKN